jgi:hypothetical protein
MKFPALWIANEGSFGVIDEPIKSRTYVAYRNRFFDGLRFFDISGDEWIVARVIPGREPGLLDRWTNRQVEVDLQFGPPHRPALSEIIERLCSCVDRDPDDIYDQFVTHDELKALFRAARSPQELIHSARTLGDEP